MTIKRALISVSDKTGIEEVAKKLSDLGVKIISTGGTSKVLKDAGVPVVDVSEVTGFPEIMEGRVKTLHPNVHGGLLAVRDSDEHMKEASDNEIEMIDLVIVNLYPFTETVAKEGVTEDEVIENIDIGGPSMLRSAAKNYKYVTVVTDPADYEKVLTEISTNGDTSLETRRVLARKVFSLTYNYDEAINKYFREITGEPELLDLHYEKVRSLRYGENPTQKAAFFRNPENGDSNITNAEVLHGKELSFNNIVDGDSALELVKEFGEPTAVFVKHNNPCGVATRSSIEEAFVAAHKADPLSAFGCVVALNREFTADMVDYMKESKMFMEIIIAPSYTDEALKRLMTRKNLRILRIGDFKIDLMKTDIKKVTGGLLIQTKDTHELTPEDLKVVTKVKPTDEQIADMLFATKVVKRVVSNSVVMAKGLTTVGVGAGQMSRVDSVFIAGHKAGDRAQGAVMSSDAFFPFPDGVEQAASYGVKAIIHPGGSIRDDEVIARADELGIAMVFSGRRYFKH
ncbi:bifunctional phosphoribosylaminoimidazolecarboxamide formyltransferase/IMP cyclohydrolase [Candidatus Peregrinibacteria bacterium]|jgi:phosphoribosylaminoimidazolecarboxamide formyltransferase / IMP cyclohydrolase|nr:bifunctional phosphoribosylaminoimidazolecarboxamide formyltransferase/IMP cyclohydrolase [Candidatus Peregrinibacteria bacterium]MBT4148628.1 bifunctional phosphoribosylaminoimidazolecarboxamide formyltransferase/IMP cyclohydrolase [Candidatus Peregrinibacteria bacterium]MBT4366237.1 bifunctional phosphoribosylaminoimidazolecarboxamide formyltransferase/IMP cyclohydrolase [Candidatus Peregrinibacteria bacterium]MBT4456369.1 bifunctional phosphoribosylaminoimidazolecarboxamide formyltransfera